MIKDYKGDLPKNVTTLEKAKAKKPFYKDWKFWVLTGLMTLFGACSVYGLVLGSQYVKAIERASHIIADAQSGQVESESLKKLRKFAVADGVEVACADLGSIEWTYYPNAVHPYFAGVLDGAPVGVIGETPSYLCSLYNAHIRAQTAGDSVPNAYDMSSAIFFQQGGVIINNPDYTDALDFKAGMSGVYIYYKTDSSYTGLGAYESGYQEGHQEGYQEGYSDGESDGYQEGYSDGSDAINVNQSVKVLLPAGAENSCSFTTYLDGVPDQQGILSSSSSFGAYGEFQRNRNQKLRIDLTLPSGSRAFFMYVPHWTSAYPSDENYSLRQSWAVSGVTYLPTWVSKPEIYVGITSALVEDLTYDTISVAFDVDHWGDVKVGAYQQGYQQGYVDGQQDPTAYQTGYDAGYADGQAQGETDGFNRGVAVGSSGSQSLAMMFKTAFQLPFDQLYRFLNFNLLGINFLSLFTALISVSIGIMVIKKVL